MDREVEVMRVKRVPPNAKLVVNVGNERFRTLDQVSDASLRGRILAAIGELIDFAGGYQALVEFGVAPELGLPPPSSAASNPELAQRQQAFLTSLKQDNELTKAKLVGSTKTKDRAESDSVEGEGSIELDLAEQIEAILQRNLALDPALAGRSIHLMSTIDGRLRIEVDGLIYSTVDEIEDAQVQQAFIEARKEWERNV